MRNFESIMKSIYPYLLFCLLCSLSSADNSKINIKLKEAYYGKIDTVPFAIGTKTEDIIKKSGKPEKSNFFDGWYYITYKNITYFFDVENKAKEKNGIIGMIGVSNGFKLFNVKIGMNMQKIQKIIGKYDFKLSPLLNKEEQSELIGEDCAFGYKLGDYELIFTAKSEIDPTNAAYLYKKRKTQ